LSVCTANVRVQSSSVAFTVQIPRRCELTGLLPTDGSRHFSSTCWQTILAQYRHIGQPGSMMNRFRTGQWVALQIAFTIGVGLWHHRTIWPI